MTCIEFSDLLIIVNTDLYLCTHIDSKMIYAYDYWGSKRD